MYGRAAVFWRPEAEGTLIGGMTMLMKIHSSAKSGASLRQYLQTSPNGSGAPQLHMTAL